MRKLICCLAVLGSFGVTAAELRIPTESYKLPNGLRVVLSKDNAVPVVAVYIAYDVGARSEEKGRTGFAHLFEHMMFEGTPNAPKGMFDSQVETNGGASNGSTHPDFTDYFELLPSNKLATGLWLESDRMRSLAITAENLQNQKEAVKQERRLSFDNRPYNTAIVDVWPSLMFRNWQSSHSLIGSFEDLNAATVEDVSKFFKTYYAPDNAVLVIVGDFETKEAKRLIEGYFGDIASQPSPKRPDMAEPPGATGRQQVYKDPLAKVPAVVVGYPGPKRGSTDFYAMVVIDAILTGGDSSRIYQDLVKEKQSVIQYEAELGWPFARSLDYRDPEPYAAFLLYKPAFTAEQIVNQVQDEISKLQNEPVSAKELERVKTFIRSTGIRELQSPLNRARALAQFELIEGNPDRINSDMEATLAVTAEQIQAAARKYLKADVRTVLSIVPAPKVPEGSGETKSATKGGR
jgi:zinc protease